MTDFSRTETLIGIQGLERLNNSRIIIFGIGGVGSYAVEALARAGVSQLILIDHDNIDPTNLNRQIHALHSTIGRPKVEVMKERILDINPDAQVETYQAFYTEALAGTFFDKTQMQTIDYVLDAIDTVASKVSLAKECLKRGIPFISSMGAGNRLTAGNFRTADISQTSGCPLAKVMRKRLREEGITSGIKVIYSPDLPLSPKGHSLDAQPPSVFEPSAALRVKKNPPGSISFVPSVVGLLMAGEVIRDLLTTVPLSQLD